MAWLKVVDNLHRDVWNRFLERNPSVNIFHTPFMMEVFKKTRNYEPFVFAAVNEVSGTIESVIAITRVKVFSSLFNKLSSRMICYGGGILNGNRKDALLRVLDYYDQSFKKKSILTEIRNMNSTESFKAEIMERGYEYEEYLNYVLDLRKDPLAIFRSFSKGRKSDIKALERKGVSVEEVTEEKHIQKIYEILQQTYQRIQVPLADISLFEATMEHLCKKGMAKFFLAQLKGEALAALVALLYKGVIITWYYGSNLEFRRFSPESLLIWHIIKWGACEGFHVLDFGGAGRPDEEYGVRDFKARFHGQMTNYGRYTKVHSPALLNISKLGYHLYRKFL